MDIPFLPKYDVGLNSRCLKSGLPPWNIFGEEPESRLLEMSLDMISVWPEATDGGKS